VHELIGRLGVAFAVGSACSAGVVWLIRILPLPDYARGILRVVLPIPPICIALVMLTYGPHPVELEPGISRRELVRYFFYGVSTWCVLEGLAALGRRVVGALGFDPDED